MAAATQNTNIQTAGEKVHNTELSNLISSRSQLFVIHNLGIIFLLTDEADSFMAV